MPLTEVPLGTPAKCPQNKVFGSRHRRGHIEAQRDVGRDGSGERAAGSMVIARDDAWCVEDLVPIGSDQHVGRTQTGGPRFYIVATFDQHPLRAHRLNETSG